MSALPTFQRAWIEERRGLPAESLKLRTDWLVPSGELQKGEILVKIQACGLNPSGYKLLGFVPDFLRGRPLPSGMDLSGVVLESNDPRYVSGDGVYGYMSLGLCKSTKQGALSEYVRLPTTHIVPRPPAVTPVQAAGLGTVSLTAYSALVELAQLEAGQTVFVYGGSSSVGIAAIQIAKAMGARVVASASGKTEAFVRSVGADDFVDYTKQPVHEQLTLNPPDPKLNLYLAPNGVFVSIGPFPGNASMSEITNCFKTIFAILTPQWLGGTPRKWRMVKGIHSKFKLDATQQLVANGLLNPPLDSVFEFTDVLAGYERQMTKRAVGKIIVKVDPMI